MNRLKDFFSSGIGEKLLIGLSGLALVDFLCLHLFGNLHLYQGADSFNHFAEGLDAQPWIEVAEYVLLLLFLIHIGMTLRLALQNRKARGSKAYAVTASKQPETALMRFWASKTMVISGSIVLAFLAVHIYDFKLTGPYPDLHHSVMTALSVPWRALLYVAGSLTIGWHLFHGIQSGFRSAGVNHPKYTPIIETLGGLLALIFGLGFASIPLWIWLIAK